MPHPRKLYLGPFQPTLEAALADEIAAFKKTNGPLALLTVVVPTHLLGLHLRRKLAPHANIHFETLDALLAIPAAPRLGLELLCRRLAKSCDDYFAPVNDTTGFASALLETFKDLEQAGITKFTGKTQKLRELATAYQTYRQWLTDHGSLQSQISNLKSPTFLYGFYDLTTVQKQFVERLAPSAVFFPAVEHGEFSRPLLDWFGGHAPTLRLSHAPTILSCPGEPAEVREAFRAVLRYVADTGKTFNDCAILCRSREQYDAIIRDTAGALGLPVYFRGGRPLAEHSDAKLLLLLLEVIRSDYSRAAVMELACHIGPHSQWDADTVELGIVAGKSQWRRTTGELAEFVTRLFAALDKIPRKGKWSEFIEPTLAAFGGSHAGVVAAVNSLAELDAFESPVSFETFAEFCQKAIEAEREPTGKFQDGSIFVGDVMSARGLSFDFVVVLGLVEKSFPRIIREDPLLLDEERAPLGLPLKRAGYAEEHLLFDLVCGTARDRLVLSYPRLDPATARPRIASFLLRQFNVKHERVKLAEFEHGDDALDAREFDLALLKGKVPGALLAEMSPHLAQGLTAERARCGESKLTAYDGIVPAAGGVPDASATQLETFAFCPFKYFAGHVLGLERWDEPERIWSADPGEIGSAVHDILEQFYKQALLPLQPKLRETYRRELRDITRERLAEFERTNVTGLPVVWSLRRAALLRDLLRFLDFEIARADALVPKEFEKNFGPVPLRFSPKLTLSLRGRIDRIDVGGGAARILDYKTGKAWHKKDDALDGGEALQLPLYALAAKEALGLPVESSEYAYLTARGGYRYVKFTREGLQKRAGDLAQILETLTAMMRAGEFPQYTEHSACAWCEFRLICGNAIEALADRKRNDPRLAPFQAVKEIE
jgi:RecB family exonuclease